MSYQFTDYLPGHNDLSQAIIKNRPEKFHILLVLFSLEDVKQNVELS